MKATLTFDLTDLDDRAEHVRCVKATDVYIAVTEINEMLRRIQKYEDGVDIDKIRLEFFEILENRGISLGDLV